jgi:hypothetical protein
MQFCKAFIAFICVFLLLCSNYLLFQIFAILSFISLTLKKGKDKIITNY